MIQLKTRKQWLPTASLLFALALASLVSVSDAVPTSMSMAVEHRLFAVPRSRIPILENRAAAQNGERPFQERINFKIPWDHPRRFEKEREENSWQSGPERRGTFSILFSCTLTIALAAWSAVIVNVQMSASQSLQRAKKKDFRRNLNAATHPLPEGKSAMGKCEHDKKSVSFFARLSVLWLVIGSARRLMAKSTAHKVVWAGLSVAMPELGLMMAMFEHMTASRLLQGLKQLDKERGTDTFKEWDMSMAFYALMGGFYIEVDDDGSPDINKPAGENVPAAEIQEQRSPQNSPVEVRTDRPKHEESNNEKHEDGNIYECCKEVDNDGKDQWPRCEEGRKRRLDKSMHKPDTIRRRTASINCTRIRYHKDNFDSSKKRLKCSECRSAKGVAKHHDKPREVLTPHGLFYLACLTNYYEGEKHETTLHLDGKKRAWYKRFFTWVASLFRSRSDATEPAEYEQHIPEENRIPKDQALQLYDQFNDMNADVLADLSKSDALAKIVLVTQGGWMIIQVVSRAFANQPIVALELHAAARIAIGVAQYMYWWYKPVSILVMTPINLPKKNYNEMMETKTWDVTNGLSVEKVYRDFMRVGMTTSGFLRKLKDEKEDGKKERMGVRQDKDNTEKIPPHTHRFSIVRWWSELTHLNEDEGMNNYYTTSESTLGKYTYKNMMKPAKPYEVIRCATSMILHLVFSWHDYPLFAIFWYICAVSYGAIHLCAWNWYFPTEWERMTWNICTLVTTLGMACLVYLSFLWSFWLFVMRRLSRAAAKQGASTGEEPWWVKIRGIFKIITLWASFLGWCGRQGIRIVGVAITIGVIPWVWARAFMLFEAYFSIREVEKGSYDVLHWVDVLPHLG